MTHFMVDSFFLYSFMLDAVYSIGHGNGWKPEKETWSEDREPVILLFSCSIGLVGWQGWSGLFRFTTERVARKGLWKPC